MRVFKLLLALWLLASPAWAGMPLILQDGQGGAGTSILQASYVGSVFSGSRAGAVVTYSGLNIGPTAGYTTRRTIIAVSTNNLSGPSATNPISSAVINGSINCTIPTQVSQGGSGTPFAAILSCPTGTGPGSSATLVITYNASIFNDPTLSVYSADDALMISTTPNFGTPGNASAATTVATGSYTQTNGGFTIAGVGFSTSVSAQTFNGGITKDQSTATQANGHANSVGPTGSTTTSASWTTSANAVLVAATWR